MKKSKFLCCGLTSIAIASLGAISTLSACKLNKNVSLANNFVANVEQDYKVYDQLGNEVGWYNVLLDEQNKTGSMNRLYIKNNTTIDKFVFPGTVTYKDCEYKMTVCDTNPWRQQVPGYNSHVVIKLLDFSQAKNLETIAEKAFVCENIDRTIEVHDVNFSGAINLKLIDNWAFAHQRFQRQTQESPKLSLDFSTTKLEKIGSGAFQQCTVSNQYVKSNDVFGRVVFPKTLKKLNPDAFEGKAGDTALITDKIIFTADADIPKDLYASNKSSVPYLHVKAAKDISVPHGTLNTYKTLNNVDQPWSSANSYVDSKIGWCNESPQGHTSITAPVGISSHDNSSWEAVDLDSKQKLLNSEYSLSCNFNGLIKINPETKRLEWSEKLPLGEYIFTVIVSSKNEDGIASFCVSDVITLKIVKPQLNGGSAILYPKTDGGEDEKQWSVSFDKNTNAGEFGVKDVSYSLEVDPDLEDVVSIDQDPSTGESPNRKCKVKWNNLSAKSAGIYVLTLNASIVFTNNLKTTCATKIIFNYSRYNYNVTIVEQDGSAIQNNEIYLNTTAKTKNVVVKFEWATGAKPDINKIKIYSSYKDAITVGTITDKDTYYECPLTINYGGEKGFKPGLYNVFAFVQLDLSTENEQAIIPKYSNEIKIFAGDDEKLFSSSSHVKFENGNDLMVTTKKTAGNDWNNWKTTIPADAGTWKVSEAKKDFKTAEWCSDSMERYKDLIAKQVGNDEINVSWTSNFCANSKWIDIYDCNMTVTISNTTTNDSFDIVQPITLTSFNFATLESVSPTIINTIPDSAGESQDPWVLVVNDDRTLTKGTTNYSIKLETDKLKEGDIYFEKIDSGIKIKWNALSRGVYPFKIIASNDEYFVWAESRTLFLNVEDKVEIFDLQNLIQTTKGDKGQTEKPLSTYLNGNKVENCKYSILNAPEGIKIDENTGVISWDGTSPIGTHELIIQSKVTIGTDQVSANAVTTFRVSSVDDNETTKMMTIIGVCAGVAGAGLGVGGTFAGININKKVKAKKAKKK